MIHSLTYYKNNFSAFTLIFLIIFSTYMFFSFLFGMPYSSHVSKVENNLAKSFIRSGIAMSSAYNSMSSQTDSTPWVTASGTRCRWGIVASNFLPFGTKIMIEGFGKQVFIVEDRMARRYRNVIDIWFPNYGHAVKYGRKKIKYWVVSLPR